jgi:hypothetical protein
MTQPIRIRLSRGRGWRLQAVSQAINGLPAVNVARPSKWGNPFKIAPAFESAECKFPEVTQQSAVDLFRERYEMALSQYQHTRDAMAELRGKNLACWCPLDQPCHADVLLDLANSDG